MKLCFLILFFISSSLWAKEYFNPKYHRPLYRPTDKLSTAEELSLNEELLDKTIALKEFYSNGRELDSRCQSLSEEISYKNIEDLDMALRITVSNFQNILFWNSIQSISFYASELGWEKSKFETLVNNLIGNYCSKNMTLFSKERLSLLFKKYFNHPSDRYFPILATGPKVTAYLNKLQKEPRVLKKYLMFSVENFQAACSWGGDTDNLRLLTNFLKDPYTMAHVASYLEEKSFELAESSSIDHLVYCNNLICREGDIENFRKFMPLSIGSQGIKDDIERLYCSELRSGNINQFETDEQLKNLIVNKSLDEKMNQKLFFHSTITGFPSLYLLGPVYNDFLKNWYKHIEYYWDQWVDRALDNKGSELLFEESIKIRPIHSVSDDALMKGEFALEYNVSLGEMDRIFGNLDKVSFTLPLSFSVDFISWAAEKWEILQFRKADDREVQSLRAHFSSKIEKALALADKGMPVSIISKKMTPLIVDQLLEQLLRWKSTGAKLPSSSDRYQEQIKVPIRFYYGFFTLRAVREKFIFQNKR